MLLLKKANHALLPTASIGRTMFLLNEHPDHRSPLTTADADTLSLEAAREFCKRHGYGDLARKTGRAREQFLVTSDTATVFAYNSEFRGFANYYSFADDNKRALGVL